MMHIDMTVKSDRVVFGVTRRCGVLCKSCDWRGYRAGSFKLGSGSRFDVANVTGRIKGRHSYPRCPKCHGECVFTHVTGSSFVM